MKQRMKAWSRRGAAVCLVWMLCLAALCSQQFKIDAAEKYVYDQAVLLEDASWLEDQISELRIQLKIDIVIVTTKNTGGKSSRRYADDFYDDHGFGFDKPRGDGVLFLIDMDNREAYISTCGKAIEYFTDARIDDALEAIVRSLKDGDYDEACREFLRRTEFCMKNEPLGGRLTYSYPQRLKLVLQNYWPVLLLLSAAIAAVCVIVMAHSSRSAKVAASRYFSAKQGLHLDHRVDQLISEFTTSREIPRDDDRSSSSGGGGSSVHTNSSGTTHGGGGKSF